MFKRYQGLSVWILLLASLLVLSLTLVACGGADETPEAEQPTAPAGTEETMDTPTAVPQEATAEQQQREATAAPAATAEADTSTVPTASTEPAICEAIEIPDNELLTPISDSDWTRGPADAPVTLIEYGDFQ